MPVKTRHPIFRMSGIENQHDADDELLPHCENSISAFADHIMGLKKKYDKEQEQ